MEHLTLQTFKDKIYDWEQNKEWSFKGERPAVIDFYADWCAPCKQLAPTMDELSEEYDGKVDFFKVNTEQEGELSGLFGIQSIPSILFIPVGEQPQMAGGALPKESFKELIEKVLHIM
ncbi:MAG: thioredoxin [Candidatus Cloacimonetes bacterium]|nr:thioredoxin [Candidatus Cloacimonadota bacterium]